MSYGTEENMSPAPPSGYPPLRNPQSGLDTAEAGRTEKPGSPRRAQCRGEEVRDPAVAVAEAIRSRVGRTGTPEARQTAVGLRTTSAQHVRMEPPPCLVRNRHRW